MYFVLIRQILYKRQRPQTETTSYNIDGVAAVRLFFQQSWFYVWI